MLQIAEKCVRDQIFGTSIEMNNIDDRITGFMQKEWPLCRRVQYKYEFDDRDLSMVGNLRIPMLRLNSIMGSIKTCLGFPILNMNSVDVKPKVKKLRMKWTLNLPK